MTLACSRKERKENQGFCRSNVGEESRSRGNRIDHHEACRVCFKCERAVGGLRAGARRDPFGEEDVCGLLCEENCGDFTAAPASDQEASQSAQVKDIVSGLGE